MGKKKDKKKKAGRPVTALLAAGDVNDKFSEYPSEGLTPQRLARIFKEADGGDVRAQMELFEEMEEKDTHLFSQLQTRKLAVTGLDWEVQPLSGSDRDKEIAEWIDGQLKGLEDFDALLIDMLDAIGKGVSMMELSWDVDGELQDVVTDIQYVHPKRLVWDPLTDEMLVCTKEYPAGMSLPENKFVIHRYKAKSGHASRAGVLRVVAWMYLFKNYDLKDWVSFCEVFGMPLRLGKYDASASEDDKKKLMEAVFRLGTDAAGIVPSSTMIEFIESQKTTSVEIYERLARYCDEQISKAVLGQTLTADSGGGSYAQSKTHDEVRHDLTVADAKALAATIRRDIIRPLVEFNFGTDVGVPLFAFDCKEAEDQKELAEVYRTLACDMGLEIPKSHVYKKFNIPKPEEGESVLGTSPDAGTPEGAEVLDLKEGGTEQRLVDEVAMLASQQADAVFGEMMKPVLAMLDRYSDLEAFRQDLKDGHTLEGLYREMDVSGLEDLVRQGLYICGLVGRTMD